MLAPLIAFAALGLPLEDPPVADRLFAAAVESSIHGFGRAVVYDQVLTERHGRLLRNLACGRYECRLEAHETLASEGPRALRALTWGQWSKDAEVRAHCRELLDRLYPCEHCAGQGRCPARARDFRCGPCWASIYLQDWEDRGKCLACNGTGDARGPVTAR
jgi:hypothetical protein